MIDEIVTGSAVKEWLPKRNAYGHKGTFGRVLVVAGSVGYTGAPYFTAEAAARSGTGLVFLGVPEAIYAIEAIKCSSAMAFPLACEDGKLTETAADSLIERAEGCDACVIGPGLGRSRGVDALVERLLKEIRVPVVLDADGINALAGNIDVLQNVSGPVVITPHEGEFSRIGGGRDADRSYAAAEFAKKYGVITHLKGHRSLTAAPNGKIYINSTGNDGMAKGGSGDLLAGMTAGLIAQGMSCDTAMASAAYLHGRAGDICARRIGRYGMTPEDILKTIPEAFCEIRM